MKFHTLYRYNQRTPLMKHKLLIASLLIATAGMTQGCTSPQTKEAEPVSAMSSIAADLREVAYSIKKENEQLALLEQENLKINGAIAPVQPDIEPSARLNKPITIKWTGGVEPLLTVISKDIDYKVFTEDYIEGQRPVVPKIIKISAYKERAYDVLKEIGWQLGSKTQLVVDENAKTIRLIYVSDY